MKTIEDCRAYRLDETTDAGEFMLHACESVVAFSQVNDNMKKVQDAICSDEVKPEDLAELLTKEQLQRALGQIEAMWGDVDTVEFETARDRAIMTRGMESAQKFLSAARRIRLDNDCAVTS